MAGNEHGRWRIKNVLTAFLILSSAALGDTVAQTPSGLTASRGIEELREEVREIPNPSAKIYMRTTVRLPAGKGPFPLVVVNHGSSENAELRKEMSSPSFDTASAWFSKRGYAVAMPQRPGHGMTGGPFLESIGDCDDPHYDQAGYAAADSIRIAIQYLQASPLIRKERVLLVGHSAGGWGSLALAARNPELASGVINFSGGLGGRSYGMANRNCAPSRLLSAAAAYGHATRVPTLWLYAQNDTYFGPELSSRMAQAFRLAGGAVDYHLLPSVGNEGHYLIYSAESVRDWSRFVERFAKSLPRAPLGAGKTIVAATGRQKIVNVKSTDQGYEIELGEYRP